MIAFFDSGLGGITVVRRARELLPQHDFVFFADQAHVPYGDRSVPDLLDLIGQNLRTLEEMRPDLIVAACNTTCAISSVHGWPRVGAPVLDLIESAAIAVQRSGARSIGVFATTQTARSGAYAKQILARVPDAHVVEIAAPALVPLVEAGMSESEQAALAVQAVCEQLPARVDAIVFGCTHYPLLARHFAETLAPEIALIDPALVQAERASQWASENGLRAGNARLDCLTNGNRQRFEASVRTLLNTTCYSIATIDSWRLPNSTPSR